MNSSRAIAVIEALSTPTRWNIVELLMHGPLTVGEIARRLAIEQYAVSKGVIVLVRAGIMVKERHGMHVVCSINPKVRAGQTKLDFGYCSFDFSS